jgi:predicted phage tail protein
VHRSLGFGLLHGLAGSAAVIVLLVAAAPTAALRIAYVAAFGLGTIVGMLGVSFLLGGVVRLASGRGDRWATGAPGLGGRFLSGVPPRSRDVGGIVRR